MCASYSLACLLQRNGMELLQQQACQAIAGTQLASAAGSMPGTSAALLARNLLRRRRRRPTSSSRQVIHIGPTSLWFGIERRHSISRAKSFSSTHLNKFILLHAPRSCCYALSTMQRYYTPSRAAGMLRLWAHIGRRLTLSQQDQVCWAFTHAAACGNGWPQRDPLYWLARSVRVVSLLS